MYYEKKKTNINKGSNLSTEVIEDVVIEIEFCFPSCARRRLQCLILKPTMGSPQKVIDTIFHVCKHQCGIDHAVYLENSVWPLEIQNQCVYLKSLGPADFTY